ncbi:transketolase family protein [Chloroflexota bacterium]
MSKTQNQRTAYGEELVSLGKENKDVVVLEADLGRSTMSNMFQAAFPERYFEMGIAEQNMLSTAAGLALSGKIAFVSSFAVFVSGRAYDQIRQTISIGKLNVKICGSSAGFSDYGDGSTHQAIEDVAVMNAIPNMTVLTPCDAEETRQAVREAATINGPVYIRLGRDDVPDFIRPEDTFELGKMRVLKDGKDIVLFAHGNMVSAAMTAAAELEKNHISTKVVSVSTMKPFNCNSAIKLTEGAKAVVTAEEHSYIGGLTSAVCLALRKTKIPVDYVAVEDSFGQSAHNAVELMIHYGLTSENIVIKANNLLAGKSS